MNLFDLTGKTALVTGAASGLGLQFAIALSNAGACVICADKDEAGAQQAEARLKACGCEALAITVDVADEASVADMARRATGWSGAVHILVNNAGIASRPGRLLDVSLADWDRVLSVNLRSLFICTRALMPTLLANPTASVINIGSFLGMVGVYPQFPVTALPYSASKAGAIGFTKQLAMEYARENVRVNCIAPGWHGGTALGRERRASATPQDLQRFEDYLLKSIPMGRRGEPEELSGLIVYLASDASRYVTGQVFAHDGGVTAA